MSDEKQHQKIVTIVQCNTQRKPLHILICTAWKNPNVIIRPCHPCLLPRGIWYQCVILSDDAWGRAAIGCRPDAVDAERDLLAPDKYRVYVATRVGWFISTIRSCILFLTTAASVRTITLSVVQRNSQEIIFHYFRTSLKEEAHEPHRA